MKTMLLVILGLICFCAVSSWEYSTTLEERMNTIPDSVYEYIILKLGDDATNSQILSYYDNLCCSSSAGSTRRQVLLLA